MRYMGFSAYIGAACNASNILYEYVGNNFSGITHSNAFEQLATSSYTPVITITTSLRHLLQGTVGYWLNGSKVTDQYFYDNLEYDLFDTANISTRADIQERLRLRLEIFITGRTHSKRGQTPSASSRLQERSQSVTSIAPKGCRKSRNRF
jgi:hypothetical protein